MNLPPGPRHILTLLPSFAIPTAVVFLAHKLLQINGSSGLSLWHIPLAVVLVRLLVFFGGVFYQKWANTRAAIALGAVIPPNVVDWPWVVIKRLIASVTTGHPCEMLFHYSDAYGGNVFQVDILGQLTLGTSEPGHIKAILATQFESFEKGSILISQLGSLLGTGVFNADGAMWKFHRSMTRPFFTKDRISDFDIYERNTELAMEVAKDRIGAGFTLDIQELASRISIDSTTEFLFGHNVESLKTRFPYPPAVQAKAPHLDGPDVNTSSSFVKALARGQVLTMARFGYNGDWPLSEFWADRVKPYRQIVDEFTEPILNRALELREIDIAEGVESKEEEFLLDSLVKHTQDRKILKDELVNLLVAARDTTAAVMTFSVYMLTQHPNFEKRLREEIFHKVGPTNCPTYEHMREMKFVRAFINEVLRLYPPVPANARFSKKATTLPCGKGGAKPIYVPANTTILYGVMNMHRRTDLWGPDALEFDPDRFIDERLNKYLVPNPFIFSPFSAGPRICLGQQFAYHEVTFFLVRLLQKFTGFALDDKSNLPPPAYWARLPGRIATEKIHPSSHLTMHVKGGLWVSMKLLHEP